MKELELTKGKVALVDDEDFDRVSSWRWKAVKMGRHWRAVRTIRTGPGVDGCRGTIYLHRQITNAPKGMDVDHIDGDSLNNQKSNLRVCTRSENIANSRVQIRKKSSRFKGVIWLKKNSCWQAGITIGGKYIYLKSLQLEEDAARCYDEAARTRFGDFARVNFVK